MPSSLAIALIDGIASTSSLALVEIISGNNHLHRLTANQKKTTPPFHRVIALAKAPDLILLMVASEHDEMGTCSYLCEVREQLPRLVVTLRFLYGGIGKAAGTVTLLFLNALPAG